MANEDPRARYTESLMRDSLIKLLARKPLSQITVKELCEKAGINRSTFYSHYTNIAELLEQIEAETFDWLKSAIQSLKEHNNGDSLLEATEIVCRHIADNGRHLGVLMSVNADVNFQRAIIRLIYDETLLAANSQEQELQIRFVVNGSIGLIQYWLDSDTQISYKTIARIIIEQATISKLDWTSSAAL